MKKLVAPLALALSLYSGIAAAQAQADLFAGKALVAPHVHVESTAQFAKWSGKSIPHGEYAPEYYEKYRLGTVTFSADLRVHIDVIRNKVHYPSYYELVDSRTDTVLGKYEVFSPDDAEWYFSGNGAAYLNHMHLQLCGPRYTRKIQQKGKALVEVEQPLVYIGAETYAESTTQLYESPNNRKVVATLAAGTKVTVLGMAPGTSKSYRMALLVKTPFGLTGWHLQREYLEEGILNIYQCN